MKRIRKTIQAKENGKPVLLHVNELIEDTATVKTLLGREVQVSIDDLIENTTDYGGTK